MSCEIFLDNFVINTNNILKVFVFKHLAIAFNLVVVLTCEGLILNDDIVFIIHFYQYINFFILAFNASDNKWFLNF
ncbi:hypothetical protein SDC9_174388 [bioreactor metagenome]|uniref:Uncharacterized protein n=1 Tax=bioreactor metagenome TaxID=1076179 RepID=A0A645GM68_9ZZZZ